MRTIATRLDRVRRSTPIYGLGDATHDRRVTETVLVTVGHFAAWSLKMIKILVTVLVIFILALVSGAQAQILTAPFPAIPLGQISNLLQCGAKGDGMTDDSVAIQNCFNNSAGGIFIPSRTFNFSTTLNVPANLFIW